MKNENAISFKKRSRFLKRIDGRINCVKKGVANFNVNELCAKTATGYETTL